MLRLPPLTLEEFLLRLRAAAPAARLDPAAERALFAHYQELGRWAERTSLLGPREAEHLFERHYAESLAALPLLPPGPCRLLDIGSGAGFPGLVLAAARPDLQATLLEPRARKCAFLAAVARKASLSCQILDARVTAHTLPAALPDAIALVTMRALRLEAAAFVRLATRLAADARLLLWSGREEPAEPPGFVPGRRVELAGSEARSIREYRRRR